LNHPLAAVLASQERSAAWLSKKCGFDPSYAHKVMSGERTPSPEFRERAARILGISASDLFPEAQPASEPV
jgi:transcriptional regulator with XRE-family HTH domain